MRHISLGLSILTGGLLVVLGTEWYMEGFGGLMAVIAFLLAIKEG